MIQQNKTTFFISYDTFGGKLGAALHAIVELRGYGRARTVWSAYGA